MQLLKLEVKNWVHHRYRVCEFTRGLVAILGENGSGKSSLFGAIRWALTGENPNFGVKADNISQYAKEGEASYVSLEFEHNGHIAVVTRNLLPEKEQSVLIVDGKEAGRGDKGVTAGVEKLLGVDAKFISRFIIVSQMEIFSFIDDNQTDTDKFFQRLFNTAKADKCQDVIGKNLAKILLPELAKTSAQLKLEGEEVTKELATLQTQVEKLPSFDAFLSAQKTDQEIINQWEKRSQHAQELNRLQNQEAEYEKQLALITANSKQHETDYAALVGLTSGKESDHAAARSALGHWQSYKSVAKAKADLQASREALTTKRLANPAPPSVLAQDIQKAQADLLTFRQQFDKYAEFIKLFTSAGIAECPTCHTPAENLTGYMAKVLESIPATEIRIAAAEATLATLQKADADRKAWEKLNQELLAREQQLAEAEEKLVAVTPPASSEDALQSTVSEYEDFQRVKAEIEPLVNQAATQKAKLAGLIAGCKDRGEQLQTAINGIVATQADEHLANARLAKSTEQYAARQKLEQQCSQLDFDRQHIQAQEENAREQEQRAVKIRAWQAVAEKAREALKNAPRLVAQRNLQRLETAINELLQIFGVNFLVRVAGDGTPSFIAEFFDGRKQVAQRLSVGQKTVLALAFRVAVNAMFAEEIGLLALDEPTASLDAARIRALAPVLEKLRDLSTAKGLQCLLVTHASNLSHLFESVIELEAPELRHGLQPAR
jgi:DNA repair exonuclease SbcCD ATPase subunit